MHVSWALVAANTVLDNVDFKAHLCFDVPHCRSVTGEELLYLSIDFGCPCFRCICLAQEQDINKAQHHLHSIVCAGVVELICAILNAHQS